MKHLGLADEKVKRQLMPAAHRHVNLIKEHVAFFSPGANNPVWGRTLNPHGVGRTPGGSSGGEGSLIGGGGSLFGLGSDNAGSARLPAAFCGKINFENLK